MALRLTTLSCTSVYGVQQRSAKRHLSNVGPCRTVVSHFRRGPFCAGAYRTTAILAGSRICARPAAATHSSRNPHYVHTSKPEDDGGTTQITALLVLSLTLLSLPWAFEHPGLLLVPVALSMLPGVGPAFVQPVLKQAFSWLMTCCQWVPRVARATAYKSKHQYVRMRPQHPPMHKQRNDIRRPAVPQVDHSDYAASHRTHAHLMDNLEQL